MLFRAKRSSEGIAYFHLILKRITLIEEQLSLGGFYSIRFIYFENVELRVSEIKFLS